MRPTKEQMQYYTYAYLREDGTPYYIGKGKGKRAYKKGRDEVKPPRDKSRIIILKRNLTEEVAFKHEIYMIAVFGRKDLGTGILRNKTDGGDGASGMICPPQVREAVRKSNVERMKDKEFWDRFLKSCREARERDAKTYELTSPDDEVFVIKNLKSFAEKKDLCYTALIKVSKGQRNHSKGWKARQIA